MRALTALGRILLRELPVTIAALLLIGIAAWADYQANQASPGNITFKGDVLTGTTQTPLIGILGGTGQTNRLVINANGEALINGTANTQPVNGTVTGNQGAPAATANRWPVQITDGTDLALVSPTGAQLMDVTALPIATATGSITALDGTVALTLNGAGAAAFHLTGAFTATALFEGTVDGTDWRPIDFWPLSGSASQTSATSAGIFVAPVGALQSVRIRANPYTSGTITVTARTAVSVAKMLATISVTGAGTSSSIGAAYPSVATAIGFKDPAGNMQPGRTADADSGAGEAFTQQNMLVKSASGGPVEIGTSADPIRNDPTGTTIQPVGGNVAHDAADAGNPNKLGCRARTSDITAVANDDRADVQCGTLGEVIVREARGDALVKGRATSIGTGNTELIAAPAAGSRLYITWVWVDNQNASIDSHVNVLCGTTIVGTLPAPANGGAVPPIPSPIRCGDAENFQFASVTGVTTMVVTAGGYKAAN